MQFSQYMEAIIYNAYIKLYGSRIVPGKKNILFTYYVAAAT